MKSINNKINSMRKMIEMIKEQYNAMVAVRLGIFKYEFKYTFEKDNISLNVFYAPLVLKANGNIGACVAQYGGINYVYTDD